MAYAISWYVPDAVLYLKCWGESSLEETLENTRLLTEFVTATPHHTVHIILNILEIKAELSPKQGLEVVKQSKRPANLGWIVIIGKGGSIAAFVASLLSQMLHVNQTYCASLGQAVEFLEKRTALNLPPSLPKDGVILAHGD